MKTRPCRVPFVSLLRRNGLPGASAVLLWAVGSILVSAPAATATEEAAPAVVEQLSLDPSVAAAAGAGPVVEPQKADRWEEDGVTEECAAGSTRIVFRGLLSEGGFTYDSLQDPPRLYVDVKEPLRTLAKDRQGLKGEAFRQFRVGRYPDRLRITLDLRHDTAADPVVQAEGQDLVVSLATDSTPVASPRPVGGPEAPVAAPEAEPTPRMVAKAEWSPVRVEAIDFQQTDKSSDVIVRTKGKTLHHVADQDKRIVVELPGAEIPTYLRRHIDTSAFPSAVLTILPEQVGSGASGMAKVVIVLREKRSYEVLQEDGTLRVQVQLPEQAPAVSPLPPPELPESGQGLVEKFEAPVTPAGAPQTAKLAPVPEAAPAEAPPVPKAEWPATPELKPAPQAELPTAPKAVPAVPQPVPQVAKRTVVEPGEIYRGTKISLDFKDADIQNVLRLIAEVSGKNIVISDAVQGKVTIRLMNVPWDLALDVVLKTYALDKEELAPNILRVAPYTQLKTERDEALKASQALQQVEKLVTKVIPVNYAKADRIQPLLEKVKSGRADASILVDSRTNALILKDLPKAIEEMSTLIRELDLQTPQVLIEAKIVELDVGFERELGIQWGMLYRAGPVTGNPTGANFPATADVGGAYTKITGDVVPGVPNPVLNLPAAISDTAGGAMGFSLASLTKSFQLDMQLSALEQKNHARVLSSPRVATLNNQEARIEQGQEVPFQTTSDEGTKTEFKDAMLRLAVTPQINFDKSIIMKIVVSNDTPIPDPIVDYIIQKKEAETTVLVNDSDTAVIGGIYTAGNSKTSGGIPWFMDVPGLGNLFKKQFREDKRTELIIFITPRIVPATQARAEDWIK